MNEAYLVWRIDTNPQYICDGFKDYESAQQYIKDQKGLGTTGREAVFRTQTLVLR